MNIGRSIRIFLAANYRSSLLIGWTVLIAASGAWNLYQNHVDTIAKAKIEARTIFEHNIAYRKWSTMHGGIYTKIPNKDKNNPHFFFKIKGSRPNTVGFTIIDPFQVTQQAYEVLHKQSSNLAAFSHTVSLNYRETIDPYDKPDAWETKILKEFRSGAITEASTITTINSAPYLKLLKPYIIDQGCLNCHESPEFKVGAVHGGMSVAIPMQPYYATAVMARHTILLTHLLLWLLGGLAIIKFSAAFQRYQETITESEKKFRIVSEFAYNFEYWIKDNNQLAFISPSCERLTGYSRREFMYNPKLLLDIIHPDDKEMYRRHLHKIDDPEHNGTDFRVITKDGQVRWFTHTCSPIYINGQFLGRRGSSIDITEHKKLEERLSHTQRLEYLGRFAGGIAHDFNNVLASINTFSHLLAEESRGNKTAGDYIKYINIATKLGKNLTANLLSFGKRQNVALRAVSLNSIISGIADILRSLVDEDISLQIKLAGDDLPIAADRHQLEQVLINLCTNARDAMPGGGIIKIVSQAVEVEPPVNGSIDEIPAGCYMRLSVTDNGEGINPADLNRICEPFFTTKDPAKGTGLGLAIIHDIVKKHGAFFDVKSVDGEGTTFAAYFPVKHGSVSLTPPLKSPDLPAPPPADTAQTDDKACSQLKTGTNIKEKAPARPASRGTILLSDDEEMVRNSLTIQLQQAGFNVLSAANGKKAISLFIDHKDEIDLAILDLLQPLRNGREIYEVIYKNPRRLPVIFISGDTNNLLSPEILARPEVNFMAKPLVIEDFMTLVENLTSGKA